MTRLKRIRTEAKDRNAVAAVLAIAFILTVAIAAAANAQTFSVLHTFTGGADGARPASGLTMDGAGRLYGTTQYGGNIGLGSIFQLTRKGAGWVNNPIYSFNGNATNDGAYSLSGLTAGRDGSFYGTTRDGGGSCAQSNHGCGTVYRLRPPAAACKTALCPWTENVIYRFLGGSDGATPQFANLVFDAAGNLYGTTSSGGASGLGTVYQLTPSNGGWTESVLYSFAGGSDGAQPWAGVIFDQAGNLYGTTYLGGGGCNGFGCGTVFELTPSEAGWTEKVLYSFQGGSDGGNSFAGLAFDQLGNFYGATAFGGSGRGGAVFELSPSNGSWTLTVLYGLDGGEGPNCSLIIDAAGNLYGTASQDGNGLGVAFRLSPGGSGWTYTALHNFSTGYDGGIPLGSPLLDANGNLYGTAFDYGAGSAGTVWEIAP